MSNWSPSSSHTTSNSTSNPYLYYQNMASQQSRETNGRSASYADAVRGNRSEETDTGKSYPPALLDYVKRAFAECRTEENKQWMKKELKEIIESAEQQHILETRMWAMYPLPSLPAPKKKTLDAAGMYASQIEFYRQKMRDGTITRKGKKKLKHLQELVVKAKKTESKLQMISKRAQMKLLMPPPPEPAKPLADQAGSFSGKLAALKRRYNSEQSSSSSLQVALRNKVMERATKKRALPEIAEREESIDSNEGFQRDDATKRRRSARFGSKMIRTAQQQLMPKKKGNTVPAIENQLKLTGGREKKKDVLLNWEKLKIRGTCATIEKKYLRLTSEPDPSTVRPVKILRKAFHVVCARYLKNPNYLYFCEQFKSIRQDLTVQHIINDFAVEVYQTHARTALEVGDLSEFNQCQTQLALMLDEHPSLKVDQEEFSAYKILYCLVIGDLPSLTILLSDLSTKKRHNLPVAHALKVRDALLTGNYVSFFRLYSNAPYQSALLMKYLIPSMRYRALRIMASSYRPSVSVDIVSSLLHFSSSDEGRQFLIASNARLDESGKMFLTKESQTNLVPVKMETDKTTQRTGVTHGQF